MRRFDLSTLLAHGLLCTAVGCFVLNCSVYNPDLVGEKPPQAIQKAAVPVAGSGSAPRDAGDYDGADASMDGDATLPPSTAVPIDTTHCGDGRVTGEEKCDIAILAGKPGACPTSCPELGKCAPRALNNSGCQAECVLLQLVCKSGDDCCPGNCTARNDADCSTACGDKMVQPEDGETCEPGTSTPCKKTAAECNDNDPCTVDQLIGSEENCNALCTNVRITEAKNGDGCCPSGAICGNKVREPGEDCDGTTGCSAQCKLTLQPEQIACLEKFGSKGDDCAKCSCMNCAPTYLACVNAMDATVNMLCNAVLTCARQKDCFGTACYCGDSFLCAAPTGECKTEIEMAAGSMVFADIQTRAADPTTPLGKAYAADTCRMNQCVQQCR
jgi:hypothetical protein